MSLIIFDIDQFEEVNDTWGHEASEMVLKQTATIVRGLVESARAEPLSQDDLSSQKRDPTRVFRRASCFARYGSGKFLAALPWVPISETSVLAKKICEAVRSRAYIWGRKTILVTVSIGIAELSPEVKGVAEFIQIAEQGLSNAKKRGRSQVAPGSRRPDTT